MVFAAIVVFVTTYAMIIPAITWERTLICPLEAHVHTDFCYNSKGELKCGKEEHRHTDACFDAAPADPKLYFCGQTAHVHDENCYFADGTLKCTLQEHKHTSDCEVSHRIVLPYFMAGSPLDVPPAIRHYADPSTKDTIINQFLKNGSFSEDNDGKVVADKTVVWNNDSKQSFTVTLSALGQSYQETVDVRYRMHPDVLFVVDMSSSLRRYKMEDENGDQVYRIVGIQNALNNSIAALLEKDPLTRIGIVSYNASSNYSFNLPMGYYLPLTGTDKEYIKLWYDGSNASSYSFYFNPDFQKADWSGVTLEGDPILEPIGYVNPSGSTNKYATATGTYTQGGLHTGEAVFTNLFNGMDDLQRSLRVPAMILVTDGVPTEYSTGWVNPAASPAYQDHSGTKAGYYTVLSAISIKQRLSELYDDYDNKFRLYAVGPGVDCQFGKGVLDPYGDSEFIDPNTGKQKTNLEACENETKGDSDGLYPGKDYYNQMMGTVSGYEKYDKALSDAGYGTDYADYADWSLLGNLSIAELNKGMEKIIDEITAIPRPILQSSRTIAPDMIDPESYVEFTDVLGDDMIVDGNPILYYNDAPYTGVKVGSGTVNDASIEKYRGWEFTLYEFEGKVTEPSTNHTVDLSEIRFYVLHDPETGKRVVEWMFPAEHLPIIFHDWDASGSNPEFIGVDPIRVAFNVHTQKGAEPGYWYYTNSTEEITTCSFELDPMNPYKNNFNETIQKTDNKTDTDENVAVYSKVGDRVYVQLGNNGKIFCDKYDIYVQKIWADSKNHDSDSVTVRLYKNGSYANKSVTLNKANDWKGSFEDLDAYDTVGNLIEYTVLENTPLPSPYNTYHTTYRTDQEFDYHREWTETITTYSYEWNDIYNLDGRNKDAVNTSEIYRIRIYNGSTTNTTLTNVGLFNPTWDTKITDTNYTSAKVTKQQWKAVYENGQWYLRSLYDGRYLGIVSGQVVLTDASNRASFDYNRLRDSSILRLGGYDVKYGSNNAQLTIERLKETSTTKPTNLEEDIKAKGTQVINSPPVDVTIKKTDEYGNVIAASGVKFGLYYDKECTEKVGTGEYLTDSTGKAIFEDLYIGGVYYVKELTAPEGYLKAPDVQKFEVLAEDNIKVETGQTYLSKDGTGKSLVMKMKNIRLYDLPATGGIGIYPIVMIGFCLTAVPLIYALYVLIQRRKRERRQTE